jgi:hypothetical protein
MTPSSHEPWQIEIEEEALARAAVSEEDELGPVYDPRSRAANGIIVLCRAALEANPRMAAEERARYERLIEEAEAVLMLGDVLLARLGTEEAQGSRQRTAFLMR